MKINSNTFSLILKNLKKFLPIVVMLLFCFFTLKYGIFSDRICWEDESHGWTIAGHTNIFQLIDLMKVEGHFLIWYLCIMPFAKLNLFYPYPMLIINWLFAVAALLVMWYSAPFNDFLKICITFSAPVFALYAVQGRCYSVGFLFLFLVMSIYKDRLNKPYQYLLWLVLAANTSLPVCVAAGILGCIFVFDLIKNKSDKKILYVIFSVLVLNLILFYFQFSGAAVPDYDAGVQRSFYINAFLGIDKIEWSVFLYKIILLRAGIIIFLTFLFRSRRAFIFFLTTSTIVFLFFTFVYNARVHHLFTIYIFAIVAYWIFVIENQNKHKHDWFNIFFIAAVLEFVFMPIHVPDGFRGISDCILDDSVLKSAKIYTNIVPIALAPSIPYLEHEGIYLYDLSGRNLSSFEGLKIYFSAKAKEFNPDRLAQDLDMSRDNYLFMTFRLPKDYINGLKYQIRVKPYKTIYFRKQRAYLYIYKITGVNTEPNGEVFKPPVSEKSDEVMLMPEITLPDKMNGLGVSINVNKQGVTVEKLMH